MHRNPSHVDHAAGDEIDRGLLAEGRIGDAMARHYDALQARARLAMRHDGEAQDVVHDTLVRVHDDWGRRGGFDLPIRVILHKRLTWQIADHRAGRARTVTLPPEWEPSDDETGYGDVEADDYVRRALDLLRGRERQVAELRYLDGRTHEEIAAHLGMTRNAVDQALWRAHQTLRGLVDD